MSALLSSLSFHHDRALRLINHSVFQTKVWLGARLLTLETRVLNPSSKVVQVAVSVFLFSTCALLAIRKPWPAVVLTYAVGELIKLYLRTRRHQQRWDYMIFYGLDSGLAVRAALAILEGFQMGSPRLSIEGGALIAALFFKRDLEQQSARAWIEPLFGRERRLRGAPPEPVFARAV